MNAEPQKNHASTNASIMRQGFEGDELQVQHETASTAIAAAAEATIRARYLLAMKRPRDWDVVRDRLLSECARPGFAESAIYRKPVGSKQDDRGNWVKAFVEGLSVRFAEAAIRHVTNFYASSTSIYDDPTKSIVRITVMDLESNATIESDVHVSKTVERKQLKKGQVAIDQRRNSYGDVVFIVAATDDEVLNKTNALVSKALRNGVLRLMPGDIQDECEEKCRATQAAKDREDPGAAKKKLFDGFSALGVKPDQLKEYLGHTNDLQPAELKNLRGIYAAIRDGETTWAAIVDDSKPSEEPKSDDRQAKVGSKVEDLVAKHAAKGPKAKPEPKAAAETAPAEPQQREPGED